jgi:hypothetical protein
MPRFHINWNRQVPQSCSKRDCTEMHSETERDCARAFEDLLLKRVPHYKNVPQVWTKTNRPR